MISLSSSTTVICRFCLGSRILNTASYFTESLKLDTTYMTDGCLPQNCFSDLETELFAFNSTRQEAQVLELDCLGLSPSSPLNNYYSGQVPNIIFETEIVITVS